MSQEKEEGIYQTIKDLTQEVKQVTEKIRNFPTEVTIISAKLLLGPDGWGGKVYYVEIDYKLDGVECKEMKSVWANLATVVNEILFKIKDSYERTHFIQ